MKQSDRNSNFTRSVYTRTGGAVGLLLIIGLVFALPASATYEQVGSFAAAGERGFAEAYGMAVNVNGAGGVPAGTVYTVTRIGEHVTRHGPKGEFLGEWSVYGDGVAVDQATGNVYVLFAAGNPGKDAIRVYNADGSQLIASFGEFGAFGETIDEGPEKIHEWDFGGGGIAVDSSGTVYLSDKTNHSESRIMVFEPQSPGDYEHYVYAGRSRDIAASHDSFNYNPHRLVLDTAGDLYTSTESVIYKFALSEPDTPACKFDLPASGILGMTVNPESGEVFYFSYKNKKIHQLAPCNSQGEFVETGAFTVTPQTSEMYALAFNPTFAYEPSRAPGVLYGADATERLLEVKMGENIYEYGRGDIFAPAVVHSPVIESESVSSVTTSTATLGAEINPKGSGTSYVFQYITDTAYQANEPAERFAGASEAPVGGAVLGSGQVPLSAAVALVGLEPDTEYRYRVIATSHCEPDDETKVCEDVGAAQTFHTFPVEAPHLPDDRAYELVSPAQKHGGEVIPADPATASCSECKPGIIGERFPMQSAPDGKAVVYEGFPFSFTEGSRNFNEYVSRRSSSGWQTTILSPLLGSRFEAFSAELNRGLLYQDDPSLTPDAPSGYANFYVQETTNPLALSPLLGTAPPNRSPGHQTNALKVGYAGALADFSRIFFAANDALTGETPFAPEAADGGEEKDNLYEWANGQLRLINVLPGNVETAPGTAFGTRAEQPYVKANLSHAISDDGSRVFWSDEAGQVYVRENGESTKAIPDLGKFLSASADGSEVLLSNGHIYDLETEETTDLTEGQGGFKGIAGQSEDLSHIYFVDTAVLTGEAENDHGAKAQTDQNNLYAWHEGAVAFVATLAAGDNPGGPGGGGDWMASPAQRTAEASPHGRWVTFLSKAPLTGYDNTGPCAPPGKYVSCDEVFLYDSAADKLICPSCNPSGARPLGLSTLRRISGAEGSLPQPRYLTDEGRLYFDTRDSLSPFDTNDGVEDVYQYEPEGVGSCKREGGCVNLISAGHEPVDSNFLAIDATGKNVFFTTRDQLVLKDRDELIDLYVAREDGGIAAETEAAGVPCQGEACQPAVIVPNDPTPASSSFEGAGNVVEKKATKKAKANRKKRKNRAKKRRHRRAHGRAANHNRGGAR